MCITSTVCMPWHTQTKEQLQNENFAWCASNRILICIAFLFVCVLLWNCIHADWLYLYIGYRFHLLFSLSVSFSRARPSFVFNFQFNLNCVHCAWIANFRSLLSWFLLFFLSSSFLPSCIYCHQIMWVHLRVYVWHAMAWLCSPIQQVPILSIFNCQSVQFLLVLFPSIYLNARPHLNDLLWKNKTKNYRNRSCSMRPAQRTQYKNVESWRNGNLKFYLHIFDLNSSRSMHRT